LRKPRSVDEGKCGAQHPVAFDRPRKCDRGGEVIGAGVKRLTQPERRA
jgi:hypothetical protein